MTVARIASPTGEAAVLSWLDASEVVGDAERDLLRVGAGRHVDAVDVVVLGRRGRSTAWRRARTGTCASTDSMRRRATAAGRRARRSCRGRHRTAGRSRAGIVERRRRAPGARSTSNRRRPRTPRGGSSRTVPACRRARRISSARRWLRPYGWQTDTETLRAARYLASAHWRRWYSTTPTARCATRRTCRCATRTPAPRTTGRSRRRRRATTGTRCATTSSPRPANTGRAPAGPRTRAIRSGSNSLRRRWKLPAELLPKPCFDSMLLFETKLPLDTPRNDSVSPISL